MIPARFQIQRQVLNFFQYLVKQPEESQLHKVFVDLQNLPIKNDWLSCAKETLKQFKINLTVKEIQVMKSYSLNVLSKSKPPKLH